MAKKKQSLDFASRIQELLEQRQLHTDALMMIEQTLEGVGAALHLAPTNGRRRGRGPGRPPGSKSKVVAADADGGPKRRRRRRRRFETTAEDFVLSFVKANKNPTTQDINGHWKGEGRGATADNTLTKLVKDGHLKRTPLGAGIRGSRYAVG